MKRNNTLKRLLSVMLVLVMALSLSVTAFAAGSELTAGTGNDGYTITIKPNTSTTTPTTGGTNNTELEGRYHAFQIFTGTVTGSGSTHERDGGNDGKGIKDPNSNTLSDVSWGNAIVRTEATEYDISESVVKALLKDTTFSTTLQAKLKEAGYEVTGSGDNWSFTDNGDGAKKFSDAKVAQAVADALAKVAESGATAAAQKFSDIVGALLDNSDYYKSTWDNGDSEWEIGKVPGGYYLIEDTYHEGDNDETNTASSEFILTVVNDITVEPKSDIPTVDKEIIGDSKNANGGTGNGNTKGDAAGVGDKVTFRLTGTLPENFDQYTEYEYTFHDTMSKGLTYNGISQVYVTVPSTTGAFTAGADDPYGYPEGTKYDIYVIDQQYYSTNLSDDDTDQLDHDHGDVEHDDPDGATLLDIIFNDLKTLKGKKVTAGPDGQPNGLSGTSDDITLNNQSVIVVEYSVTVNEDAEFTNDNKVYLEYSNEPEGDGKGTTTEEEVFVYTFELDNTKKGIGDPDQNGLGGAGFALSKKLNGTTYYAYFTKDGNDYTVAGWISEDDLAKYLGVDSLDEFDDWGDVLSTADGDGNQSGTYSGPSLAGKYLVASSAETTGKFNIKGLDEGTYTLSEKVTPDGYNTMDDFDITITAVINETTGALEENTNNDGTRAEGPEGRDDVDVDDDDIEDTGIAELEMQNTKTLLPGTGGMGTTYFYIAGVLLLIAAIVYLSVTGRKKAGAKA